MSDVSFNAFNLDNLSLNSAFFNSFYFFKYFLSIKIFPWLIVQILNSNFLEKIRLFNTFYFA